MIILFVAVHSPTNEESSQKYPIFFLIGWIFSSSPKTGGIAQQTTAQPANSRWLRKLDGDDL
jgi:hypothetical protein